MDNRKIDALLAEHVRDLETCHDSPSPSCPEGAWFERAKGNHPGNGGWKPLGRRSSTGDGMLAVIEAMEKQHGFQGHNGFMLNIDHNGWYAEFPQPRWEYAEADTAPLAVALAALRALGVDVEGAGAE